MKSQPITISRFSNGTLVKLNVTDTAFVSYDYNPDTDAATYIPNTITITPSFSGGVRFGKWRYSTNGANFHDVVSGQHGFTTSGDALILSATSDLYQTTNSAVIVACYGDNPLYYDTVTIMRYVDPTFVYKRTSTAIKQTNDKISLIATEEQLARYGSQFTVLDDLQAQIDIIPSKISLAVREEHGIITGEMNTALAEYATLDEMESRLELTSQSITSSVSRTYQTKSDAVEALQEAKDYADGQVDDVKATLRSEIQQSANSITSTVSATYQTKSAAEDDLEESKSYTDTKATQLESRITQTANSITSTVSQNYQSKTDAASDLTAAKNYADSKDATLKSQIKQTTDAISTEVSKKVGKTTIISEINQSAESVKIQASKVNITGFVTVSDLSTAGKTTINGSNITTGSISADLIKGGKLILRPSGFTSAIEVQNSSGTKLLAIDTNGVTGYSNGTTPTFKLNGTEISFYQSSSQLTMIKNGDIYTAGKLYFTSGSSYAGTHIIEIGQTSSGSVINVISGKTSLKETVVNNSSGKGITITAASSNNAIEVTAGKTSLKELTAGTTSVGALTTSGALTVNSTAKITGKTTITNQLDVSYSVGPALRVSVNSNSSDAIYIPTGRANLPNLYGAIFATSTTLGFFGKTSGTTKQTVNNLSTSATLANVITKVNDLLKALRNYNLIGGY